jgi:hypothetical protein
VARNGTAKFARIANYFMHARIRVRILCYVVDSISSILKIACNFREALVED